MGAGTSKTSGSGSQHVFASETPVQFSQELVNSLQASSESDSSRAKSFEALIQSRVAEELSRLEKREEQVLADIESKLTSTSSSNSSSPSESPAEGSTGLSSYLPSIGKKDDKKDLGREGVLKEIEALKLKLLGRRQVRQLDQEVEKAKNEVVSCLRTNDRRPLDCWREVQTFKDAVAKMETEFVDRVMG